MKNVMLFAGTTEGKRVIALLERFGIASYVSVATAYGSQVLGKELSFCQVLVGRMDAQQIEDFLRQHQITLVIDATHPYAVEVTGNVKNACRACDINYLRIVREQGAKLENAVYFSDMAQVAEYLCEHEGNVLLTTGSKALECFTHVNDYENRVYARILPIEQSVQTALCAGYPKEHLICEKGPFTQQQNVNMLRQCNARYLVSKDTGDEGGLPQKAGAVQELGISLLVVERPKEDGITIEELECYLQGLKADRSKE